MVRPEAIIRLIDVNYSIKINNQCLHILQNINLTINSGETIAITGPSGSGKTSLLTLMAGLEKPSSGHIFYDREDITILTEDERARLRGTRIGFIFQFFQLLPNLTALENIMLPLEINQIANARPIASEWLAKVGLTNRANHYPLQLSGGEQQRIAIARAFAITPQVLFADEPTGNLDKKTARSIIDLLFDLNREHHSTLVMVTHDEALANRCQFQWPLVDGKLQC